MEILNVALLQIDIKWENKMDNLDKIAGLLGKIKEKIDLVILPELFSTGFSMNVVQLAEKMDGGTVEWLKEKSKKMNCLFMGSLIIEEDKKYFNRLIVAFPNGEIKYYNKKHLFRIGEENEFYSPGNNLLIIEYMGWRICPLVCYDLRFPVWSRNAGTYDMLVYLANWPEKRRDHWIKLLYARAIENQAFVIGVNRVGADGKNINYSGDSMVISPLGDLLNQQPSKNEKVIMMSMNRNEIVSCREKFPAYLDADRFKLL